MSKKKVLQHCEMFNKNVNVFSSPQHRSLYPDHQTIESKSLISSFSWKFHGFSYSDDKIMGNGSYGVPIPIPQDGVPQGTPDFQMTPFLQQGGHLIGGSPNGPVQVSGNWYSGGAGIFSTMQQADPSNGMPGMAAEFVNNENGMPGPNGMHQQAMISGSPPFPYQNMMNLTTSFGAMGLGPQQIQQRDPQMFQQPILHGKFKSYIGF